MTDPVVGFAADVLVLLVLVAEPVVRGERATATAAAVAASPLATSTAVSGPPARAAVETAVTVDVVPIVSAGTPGSPPGTVAGASSCGAVRCSGTTGPAVAGPAIPSAPPSVIGTESASGG
ncbi:hypothetical protein AB0N09_42635 [Streptomyces erythrochromogenes]|uniref:hypothetical protein n=1 Tax=Streptomyces erythrochromogenes TaxID=285574 RepID=UPI003428873D